MDGDDSDLNWNYLDFQTTTLQDERQKENNRDPVSILFLDDVRGF
jgi:hypothetical protein